MATVAQRNGILMSSELAHQRELILHDSVRVTVVYFHERVAVYIDNKLYNTAWKEDTSANEMLNTVANMVDNVYALRYREYETSKSLKQRVKNPDAVFEDTLRETHDKLGDDE